ncbi:MAG: DEAD/DEAH box helicase family protein [Bacillota bacterium]
MATILKPFQQNAVDAAVESFLQTASLLNDSATDQDRRNAIAYNGCMLIEAPTGAGKTLIAGHIAEQLSAKLPVVWMWFAPLKGLINQSETVIRAEFPRLNVRDARNDRDVENISGGSVYALTWASIAASNEDSRKIRQDSESSPSIDKFLLTARRLGFFVGVVIDEAHHGFVNAQQALTVYREVIDPDFAIMITATPDDKDVERFRKAVGLEELRHISISRQECVRAGIVKKGVRAIAFFPDEEESMSDVADMELAALRHGVNTNAMLGKKLLEEGIDLVPLLLVQVDSSEGSIDSARRALIDLGVPEAAIAVHTAAEPDPDLLAIAGDESVQVLIFKMAVALGFDAPRAFALVSLRRVRDANFGVQIVGRIVRVDKRLQGRIMPDELNYGYVALANYDSQSGLVLAAEKINSIVSDLEGAAPSIRVTPVIVGSGSMRVDIADEHGGLSLFPDSTNQSFFAGVVHDVGNGQLIAHKDQQKLFEISAINPESAVNFADRTDRFVVRSGQSINVNEMRQYNILAEYGGFSLLKEVTKFSAINDAAENIAAFANFTPEILGSAMRRTVKIKGREIEIFSGDSRTTDERVALNMRDIYDASNECLFSDGYIDSRELKKALLKRLRLEFERAGWENSDNSKFIADSLALILAQYPKLLRDARKKWFRANKGFESAAVLPETLVSEETLMPSSKNIYGRIPSDLNNDELAFAELLDNDTSGLVKGWLRNKDRTDWAAGVIDTELPTVYYPDFAVFINGRASRDSVILVEVKGGHILNAPDTVVKARMRHMEYGKVIMVSRQNDKWYVAENDANGERNVLNTRFRLELLKGW